MAVATVKPSAYSGVGSLHGGSWSNQTLAYDGDRNDLSTAASGGCQVDYESVGMTIGVLNLTGFAALPAHEYTSKRLCINWEVWNYYDPAHLGPTLQFSYSLNGGSTWTNLGPAKVALGSGQESVELPLAQNTTLVQVKAVLNIYADEVNDASIGGKVYDVWIDGTYGSAPSASFSGKKSAALAI